MNDEPWAKSNLPPTFLSFLNNILIKFIDMTYEYAEANTIRDANEAARVPELKEEVSFDDYVSVATKTEYLKKEDSVPPQSGSKHLETHKAAHKAPLGKQPAGTDEQSKPSLVGHLQKYYSALFDKEPTLANSHSGPYDLAVPASDEEEKVMPLADKIAYGINADAFKDDYKTKLRVILAFSYHYLFGLNVESVAKGPFAMDNLIEMTGDFGEQLSTTVPTQHLQSGPWSNTGGASNTTNGNFQTRVPGHSGSCGTGRAGGSSREGGDGNRPGRSPRDNSDDRNPPGDSDPQQKGSSLRLSCPFRIKDPYSFNVRNSYSCSMTAFSSFPALR